jgi:hypothetical protein
MLSGELDDLGTPGIGLRMSSDQDGAYPLRDHRREGGREKWVLRERRSGPDLHQNGAAVSRRATSSRESRVKSARAAAGMGSPGMNFSPSGFTYVPLCTMR